MCTVCRNICGLVFVCTYRNLNTVPLQESSDEYRSDSLEKELREKALRSLERKRRRRRDDSD